MSGDWFSVLEAARRVRRRNEAAGRGHGFMSDELAVAAGIRGTERSSARDIASAWCSKMEKWGYLESSVTDVNRGRPQKLYDLTEQGWKREKPKHKITGGKR